MESFEGPESLYFYTGTFYSHLNKNTMIIILVILFIAIVFTIISFSSIITDNASGLIGNFMTLIVTPAFWVLFYYLTHKT